MKKSAIIDLGTNTFHLMIAQGQTILSRERTAVKIGLGGINEGIITDEGLGRAIVAMKNFRATLDREGVRSVMAFGTSAFRNARNGPYAASRLQDETGIPVRIISGDEEAEFIYEGVRAAVPIGEEIALIADIGGGSVEFILANSHNIVWKHSFEIGAQRLLERFQKHDPIENAEIVSLKTYLHEALTPLLAKLSEFNPGVLIGSSGSFDTLSEMHCLRHALPYHENDPETPLTIESFSVAYSEIKTKNRAERLQMPGMIELRVDMIVVACVLIDFLLEQHMFRKMRVSTYSLKEGVLASVL